MDFYLTTSASPFPCFQITWIKGDLTDSVQGGLINTFSLFYRFSTVFLFFHRRNNAGFSGVPVVKTNRLRTNFQRKF